MIINTKWFIYHIMELLTFNVEDGYTEALIRGMRTGYIRKEEYDSLRDCISM